MGSFCFQGQHLLERNEKNLFLLISGFAVNCLGLSRIRWLDVFRSGSVKQKMPVLIVIVKFYCCAGTGTGTYLCVHLHSMCGTGTYGTGTYTTVQVPVHSRNDGYECLPTITIFYWYGGYLHRTFSRYGRQEVTYGTGIGLLKQLGRYLGCTVPYHL